MPNRIAATTKAEIIDFDGKKLTDPTMLKKLDGIACVTDSVLNYLDDVELDDAELQGGFLRLTFTSPMKHMQLSIEIVADRKLSRTALNALKANLIGQVSDGIGAGAFDDLSAKTDLSVEFPGLDKLVLKQSQGRVWLPRPTTASSIEKKYDPIKKLLAKDDQKTAPPNAKQSATKSKKPNPRKLLRLLDKLERDTLIDEIKTEIGKVGGDLGFLTDGQLPYGNFREPRLLKLLLKAGLSPEIVDTKGHHLLWQAAVSPRSIAVLLDLGVNIDRRDSAGETALMRAASLGRLKSVEVLLARGADPAIKDKRGRTAIDHARTSHDRNEAKVIAALEKASK